MKTRNVNGVEIPVFRYVADNGNFLTYALFYEYRATHIVDFQSQIFNLKEDDYKGTYSLKKIYLSFNDPTEYSFAIAVFGNWKYWKRLQSSSFLQLHLEEWREEMEIKLRSKGIDIQVGIAGDDLHKSQAAASKWLADKGWELKKPVGRPSKAAKEAQQRQDRAAKSVLERDARLVGVPVAKHGSP